MAIDSTNIEIGEGDLSIKFGAEVAGTDVGACRNASLNVETEDKEVETGQYIDSIASFDVKRNISLTIELLEDTMRNAIIAFGGDPADAVDANGDLAYDFAGNSVQGAKFMEIIYAVPQVQDKTKAKTYQFYTCKVTGGVTVPFQKANEKVYTVTFKAYADPANSGSPGKITYTGKGTPI